MTIRHAFRILAIAMATTLFGCSQGGNPASGAGPGPAPPPEPPPAPVSGVTLNASSRNIAAGETVELNWVAPGATKCTASGAWTGEKPPNGKETSPPLTAPSQFSLECAGPQGTSAAAVHVDVHPVAVQSLFPLHVEGLHLVDASGTPFLIQGDTAWSLIVQLDRADTEKYLQDRRARGFNTLLVNLIEHRFAAHPPANAAGDQPFLTPGDFSTPNDRYFAHADWVLERAEQLGFAVLLLPAYLGYDGGDEGWYQDLKGNSDDKLRQYGSYIGNRYKARRNIIWVYGGDYDPPEKRVVESIADGIRAADPDALGTAHDAPGTSPAVFWAGRPWLQLDNIYTYDPAYRAASAERKQQGTMPFFLMETSYENEHDIAVKRVRAQAYQALLSGASGQVFGNSPIWHFDSPKPLFPSAVSWQDALSQAGSVSMTHLWDIFSPRRWWTLEPDERNELLVGGLGEDFDRAVAAVASDRSFALVYVPSARTVEIDPGRLAGPAVRGEWVEAATGAHLAVAGSPFASAAGRQSLATPQASSAKDDDWVLILESTASPN